MNTTMTLPPEVDSTAAGPGPVGQPATPPEAYLRGARGSAYGPDPRRKSPVLATMLAAMPGLGQVYVGYYQQAVTNAAIVGTLLTALNRNWLPELEPLLVILLIFFYLYGMIDAGRRASLYNEALAGLRPMDLPENEKSPAWHGSLTGGAILVVAGLVLFSHTMFGVSLEWLAQWWPLGLVAFGGWLIYGAMEARRAEAGPDDNVTGRGDDI